MFAFLKRLPLRTIVAAAGAEAAQHMLEGIVRELPDVLLACLVEVPSGNILASYTTHSSYNPNHFRLRYAKLLQMTQQTAAANAWWGGPLLDLTVVLEDQLHHLRPLRAGEWYCFVAVRLADANLALTKEVVRRCTS